MRRRIPEAIRDGNLEALRRLLEEDPSAYQLRTEQGLSFLLLAVYYGRRDMAELLRGDGSKLGIVEAAAMGERTRVAQHLQESPASVNAYEADGYTALHLAAYFRHVDIARMLLMARADANIEARNVMRARPLHSALYQTDHYVAELLVRMLLEAGADPKAPRAGGLQPIHVAVLNGHDAAAKLLVGAGADPNARTDDGKTPTMLRAEQMMQPTLGA